MNIKPKHIILIVGCVLALIVFSFTNPFAYNDATERTVVTTMSGDQFVRYEPGPFFAGFFAKKVHYPNQISISYQKDEADYDLTDNTIEIGKARIQFSDGTQALCDGIVQYILPTSEKEMIEMHNAHRSAEGLVKRRLAPYTQECLSAAAQLMTSEMHYSGGKAQMTQDYLNQLQNGSYLLSVRQVNTTDTIEHTQKTMYLVQIQMDKDGQPKRKFSSIKGYGITVGDAQITYTDYEAKVDSMLAKKIEASTAASVSKQRLMTAQQQAMTAEAEGRKTLVEIEYKEKQKQTVAVVNAQTQVETSKQYLLQQDIDLQASVKESQKIKNYADANAYDKAKSINADNGLNQKLEAYKEVQRYWAEALSNYKGDIVPTYQSGGSSGNGAINFMDLMGAKAAKDLSLDLKNK